jgi:tetratricopeptide (TPR) repeat protein
LPLVQQALQLDPDNTQYVNTLGVALHRLGRNQEAIACLEKNAKSNGEVFAFDGFFLAMAYHHIGDPDSARHWFDQSNAWFKQRTDLSADLSKELTAFRAEAAALLGIKDSVATPGH